MGKARQIASMANDQSQEQKSEVIKKAQRTVHFATLMDICHFNKFGVGIQIPKITKDVLCSEATVCKTILALLQFLRSRVRHHHKRRPQVMDVIARLPECAGHAADAVSAYTQVKMEDASASLKFLKSECPDI